PRVVRGGVAGERAVGVEALDLPGPLLALARPKAVDHAAAALEREPAGRARRIRGQRHEAAGAIGATVHPQERAILGAPGGHAAFPALRPCAFPDGGRAPEGAVGGTVLVARAGRAAAPAGRHRVHLPASRAARRSLRLHRLLSRREPAFAPASVGNGSSLTRADRAATRDGHAAAVKSRTKLWISLAILVLPPAA